MTAAERVAAALRDLADMVEETGVTDLDLHISNLNGKTHVRIEPYPSAGGRSPQELRQAVDDIAAWTASPVEASHSRGDLWWVGTRFSFDGDKNGRLPVSGVAASVHRRIPGRPLDLAPLPQRRRRTGGAA